MKFFATTVLLPGYLALGSAQAADSPLILEKSMLIADVPVGPYSDNLSVDAVGRRIFATPQAAKSVAVLDLKDGHVLKMIPGFAKLHSVFYHPGVKRIFVADGTSGDLKVFSGDNYALIKSIPLAVGADGQAYDPHSNLIYVGNGGDDAKMDHTLVSVVDPQRMEKIADIRIAATDLEAIEVDPDAQMLYANMVEESAVAVVDLRKRQVANTWKLPAGKHAPFALAVDSAHHRLYVTCRDDVTGFGIAGTLFVLDTNTGNVVAKLDIGGWTDGVFLDKKRQRIYVSTGVGRIETYQIGPNDSYRRLADVETPLISKHGVYSAELDRLYVDAPHLALTSAQVLSFKPLP